MDPPGFVTVWCNRSRKPLVLFYDDNEVFAVADEPILAWMFKLEGGTGSIYIVVEEHGGDDSDGDAFFVGRPVAPNEITPPSWNLPRLQTGRYVVDGTGKSSDVHADVNNPVNHRNAPTSLQVVSELQLLSDTSRTYSPVYKVSALMHASRSECVCSTERTACLFVILQPNIFIMDG
ncbi:hypothetical protein R1sor_005971 [Riccia sorocarpa]|uniref:Uncharacterized protein n=1 Tax=Riccia sorocarpa TaxID=122646 RepID=A0ABD3HPW0_9MARC